MTFSTEETIIENGKLNYRGLALMQELEKRLAAIAAVPAPAGGGTVDTQARAAIDAIRAASA